MKQMIVDISEADILRVVVDKEYKWTKENDLVYYPEGYKGWDGSVSDAIHLVCLKLRIRPEQLYIEEHKGSSDTLWKNLYVVYHNQQYAFSEREYKNKEDWGLFKRAMKLVGYDVVFGDMK